MDCFHLPGTLFWTGCVTDLELPTTTLESLMSRPVRIRLETNGKNRKQKPVKLPSKTMHICFSRLKSSSLHYSQYTLPSNESKKKLLTSKPIFPFSAVKPFGTLFCITYRSMHYLHHWEIESLVFPYCYHSSALMTSHLEIFFHWTSSLATCCYLHQHCPLPTFLGEEYLDMQIKDLRKMLLDQVKSASMISSTSHWQQAY